MSVTTKVACLGLVRDSAPELASQANGLRKAENVVLRSPGVLETRPGYDVLTENTSTSRRIRALREFQSKCLAVWIDGASWGLNSEDDVSFTLPSVGIEPVDYDACETKFAEARKNLYATGKHGPWVVESADPSVAGVRLAGVEIQFYTDWHGAELTYNDLFVGYDSAHPEDTVPISDQVQSVAYRFVFLRKDSNGYVRRSAPSYEILTTCLPARNDWGFGTRFYFDRGGVVALAAGDQVEFYRTRSVPNGSPRFNVESAAPRPDYFLAFAYTITQDDVDLGYFVPPKDVVKEADLGAELYTNLGQGTAAAAKYPPPSAQVLAWYQRCMWYGRTITKQRSPTIELRRLWRAGPVVTSRIASVGVFDGNYLLLAGPAVDSAASLVVGMPITDSLLGPTVAGALIPAGTLIIKIETVNIAGVDVTKVTLSNNCTGGGTLRAYIMSDTPGQGMIAERTGEATYAIGSPFVTGISSTDGWVEGMYWTDNVNGPTAAGVYVPAGTKIVTVGAGAVELSANATSSGVSDAYVGDVVTVNGVDFYAWIEFYGGPQDLTDHTALRIWDGRYPRCFAIHDAGYGVWSIQAGMSSLISQINYYSPTLGVRAAPNGYVVTEDFIMRKTFATSSAKAGDLVSGGGGDSPYSPGFSGNGDTPYPGFATGFALEETGLGGAAISFSSTCPQAFSPELTADGVSPTEAENRANRLYFSEVDEPEAVPLLNYIDLGAEQSPILALVPLRNALLVFKTDGVFRVTGYAPNAWSAEPLDPTMRLLRPEAVTASQNKAYAWAAGGIFEVDETSARSLTAEKIDKELRDYSAYVTDATDTHGVFVNAIQQRNLVLFGVPNGQHATKCAKVYAFNQTTNGWTEWPVQWEKAAESASLDRNYYSRPEEPAKDGLAAVDYEVRRTLQGYDGKDRGYLLGDSLTVSGDTITIDVGDFGTWRPVAGDFISAVTGSLVTYYRRIVSAVYNFPTSWTLTLESFVPDGSDLLVTDAGDFFVTDQGFFFAISDLSLWEAHEAITLKMEWQPTGPGGIPTGIVCREMQFQMDLTQAPDPASIVSTPEYVVGASSERDTSPYTVTSHHARTRTVQPLRVGVSRQVARNALIAPYFQTSDVFAFRLVGASMVFEGTSEKTRR